MNNIVPLETFALIFRTLDHGTDIIQLQRHAPTAENTDRLLSSLKDKAEALSIKKESAGLAFAFFTLIDSTSLELQVTRDPSNRKYWYVADPASSVFFDPNPEKYSSEDLNEMYSKGVSDESIFSDTATLSKSFDLLMQVQPKAKRYEIEEIITIENQENSAFLNDKKAMDYLYNLGVFGTFKK